MLDPPEVFALTGILSTTPTPTARSRGLACRCAPSALRRRPASNGATEPPPSVYSKREPAESAWLRNPPGFPGRARVSEAVAEALPAEDVCGVMSPRGPGPGEVVERSGVSPPLPGLSVEDVAILRP